MHLISSCLSSVGTAFFVVVNLKTVFGPVRAIGSVVKNLPQIFIAQLGAKDRVYLLSEFRH